MLTTRHLRSAALALACLAACACRQEQGQANEAANAANAAQQQNVPQIPLPARAAPMSRQQLLVAAMQAASDYAAQADDRETQKNLADKNFEFRIRFGCGDGDEAGAFSAKVDQTAGSLKVRAAPSLSTKDDPVKAVAGEAFEEVEGFWVDRPWLLSAACPRVTAAPKQGEEDPPGVPPKQRKREAKAPEVAEVAREPQSHLVGIAQFFMHGGPRTLRRSGRAYEATKKLTEGDTPTGGFDLVLSGRLVALPGGRVIACTAQPGSARPSCVISVEFGKIWIERADTQDHLAEWGSG